MKELEEVNVYKNMISVFEQHNCTTQQEIYYCLRHIMTSIMLLGVEKDEIRELI